MEFNTELRKSHIILKSEALRVDSNQADMSVTNQLHFHEFRLYCDCDFTLQSLLLGKKVLPRAKKAETKLAFICDILYTLEKQQVGLWIRV